MFYHVYYAAGIIFLLHEIYLLMPFSRGKGIPVSMQYEIHSMTLPDQQRAIRKYFWQIVFSMVYGLWLLISLFSPLWPIVLPAVIILYGSIGIIKKSQNITIANRIATMQKLLSVALNTYILWPYYLPMFN